MYDEREGRFLPVFLDITIPTLNFLIMFTVGTSLTFSDFKRVARVPKTVIVASLAQIIFLPLAGVIVVNVLSLNEFIVAGLLLIAASPGGSISNFYVYLAQANVALSIVMTGLSCLAAVVTMPLVMAGFEHFMNVPETFHVPIDKLILALILFQLLPIILGMLFRYFKPVFVIRHKRWLRGGSLLYLSALVILVICEAPEAFTLDFAQTFKASASMALLAILAGVLVGWMLKLEAYDFWPVVNELMVQNIALASTIAVTVFHQARFASFAAGYFLVQVPFAIGLILLSCRSIVAKQRRHNNIS